LLVLNLDVDGRSYVTLADSRGVPLWYRVLPENRSARVSRLNADGHIDVLVHSSVPDNPIMRLDADTANFLMTFDLKGRVVRTVRPSEDKPLPIDFHGFVADGLGGYYFLSNRILPQKTPAPELTNIPPIFSPGEVAQIKLCLKAEQFRAIGGRVVRADRDGKVTWSHDLNYEDRGDAYNVK
jgi:hypothetical protein